MAMFNEAKLDFERIVKPLKISLSVQPRMLTGFKMEFILKLHDFTDDHMQDIYSSANRTQVYQKAKEIVNKIDRNKFKLVTEHANCWVFEAVNHISFNLTNK